MFAKQAFLAAITLTALLQPGLASETAPTPAPEKTELTPQEKEMAHKMWLFQQALPHKDIVQGQIAPTLHAVSQPKKFMCPTDEELFAGNIQGSTFVNDGIYFIILSPKSIEIAKKAATEIPLSTVEVSFSEDQIARIECKYAPSGYSVKNALTVDFKASGLDNYLITMSPENMKKKRYNDKFVSYKNVEFTATPMPQSSIKK